MAFGRPRHLHCRLPFIFKQPIKPAKRHRPYSCTEAPGRPVFSCPPRERTEGARDARGPEGPTGLDASRHRGCRSPLVPQVRQFPGVPRAVFVRFAPHRPRWTDHFRQTGLSVGQPIHRSRPKRCPALLTVLGCRRQWGHVTCGKQARTIAAWTAGPAHRISDAQTFPATAPRPASGDADQTPLGNGAGSSLYIFL
jgi:hypothetical protein